MTTKELEGLRSFAPRGQPYGNKSWQTSIAKHLGLELTLGCTWPTAQELAIKVDLPLFSLFFVELDACILLTVRASVEDYAS